MKSTDEVGTIQEPLASELGFTSSVKVFAGGGDNACGAIGAGIINDNDTLCSIGTSGVIVNVEKSNQTHYKNNIHFLIIVFQIHIMQWE